MKGSNKGARISPYGKHLAMEQYSQDSWNSFSLQKPVREAHIYLF